MTKPYILYGSPLSPFQRKVEAVLALKNLDYDCEPISIPGPPDWYCDINPLGSIPTLRDTAIGTEGADGTICDSSAICGYMEKKHPEQRVYPTDPFDYGRALWIEEFSDTGLAAAGGLGIFRPIMFSIFQGKEPDLDTARKSWNEKLPPLWDYLEGCLDGGSYFIGDSVTIADIAVSGQLHQTGMLAGSPDKSKWPALVAHYEAMLASESFARNRTACEKFLSKFTSEKFDLS